VVFDITHLKKIRKQLDLTQYAFAKEAGISQSMVAKIESGKLDPTYSYIKKIEKAIENLSKNHEKEAKEIMCKEVIIANKKDNIKDVVKLFQKHSISQIPVVEKNQVIGLLTESSLLDNMEKYNEKSLVEDFIEESPPIITKNTKIMAVTSLLKFYPILIVQDFGKLIGVITKTDIIKSL